MKIKLKDKQNIWFTTDCHYGQANICRGVTEWKDINETRDFSTIEEMNNLIVNNINSLVKADDILVCLGDWSFGGFDNIKEFRDKIYCKNIIIFLGNHDHHIKKNKDNIRDIFMTVDIMDTISLKTMDAKHTFFCCHYPLASWPELMSGAIHLHGHLHSDRNQRIHGDCKSMDVSLEGNNYYPYSLEEILDIMDKQPIGNLKLKREYLRN